MPKHRIVLARIAVGNTHRTEITDFVIRAETWTKESPLVEDLFHTSIGKTPTPVARNFAVSEAKRINADILVMVDDDMGPNPDWFPMAMTFLFSQPEPSVIVSPYCCAPPKEEVQIFEWQTDEANSRIRSYRTGHVNLDDAANRKGVQRIQNAGTGLVAYDMRVFDKIKPPYYDYGYDEHHTKVTETEDCFLHRRLNFADVPIWVSWDHWSYHFKVKAVGKPVSIALKEISELYLGQARAHLIKEPHVGSAAVEKMFREDLKADANAIRPADDVEPNSGHHYRAD